MAAAAFRSLYCLWLRRERVSLRRRIRLYNAYVLPVLLYNCGTWGLNEADLKRVSAFHRKQLRAIAGIHFPRRISNVALYELTGTIPIETNVARARLRLFGHVLRLNQETPKLRSRWTCISRQASEDQG